MRLMHVVIVLCTVVFLQCITSTNKENVLTLTAADNGKSYGFLRNSSFDVKLNECRGCADIWKIEKIDTSIIQLKEKSYSNPSCSNCVGGNQDVTFSFYTVNYGSSELVLSYFTDTLHFTIGVWARE